MLTEAEIAGMRQTTASALPDWCEVTRGTGEWVLDPVTLVTEPDEDAVVVYAGPCRVRPQGAQEQEVQVGDLHETTAPYVGTLPATVADAILYAPSGLTVEGDPNDVVVDDYLTVTVSTDPSMTGRSFQLAHVGWSTWQLDRRIGLRDREQPQGVEVPS